MRHALWFCILAATASGVVFGTVHSAEAAPGRPNILWLVCEDSSVHWIGCYGNKQATTPHIDGLAKQGFRYTHAYACAPVCAPSRSTWITGMFAVSLGTQPMRSRFEIPHSVVPYYPDALRRAGYFTANFKKTDYNIGGRPDKDAWNAFADNAWELRSAGQPFFQVLNFEDSHESRAFGDIEHTRHAPSDMVLRAYHPDIPEIRKNYAKYQDSVETMDAKVGKALERLKQAGLEEDTIVIFNSDHGGVLPRSKRWLYNSGTHAPLIVRIPEKYKHLWPAAAPGSTVDRLVSFIDFPKTWLSLAGAEVPERMQGRVFLGPAADPEPAFVYGFRDRMDERFDSQRSVRSKEFVYIQSAMPNVPWGQTLEYLWKMPATQAWEKAHRAGLTNAVTGRFFGPKPVEELYDTRTDPDNVVDLAGRPEHAARVASMRAELRRWQLEVRDSGLLPEGERARRAASHGLTVFELVRRADLYPLERYLDARDLALKRDPNSRAALEGLLRDGDAGLRYWGAYGVLLLVLEAGDAGAKTALVRSVESALRDVCPEVRATAAWAWMAAGKGAEAWEAMSSVLRGDPAGALLGLNILDWVKEDSGMYKAEMEGALASEDAVYGGYLKRMVSFMRERREGAP